MLNVGIVGEGRLGIVPFTGCPEPAPTGTSNKIIAYKPSTTGHTVGLVLMICNIIKTCYMKIPSTLILNGRVGKTDLLLSGKCYKSYRTKKYSDELRCLELVFKIL